MAQENLKVGTVPGSPVDIYIYTDKHADAYT